MKQLRRQCEARLAALNIPEGLTVTELCAHIGKQRGRAIQLVSTKMEASNPCGIWVAAADTDFVFYDAETSKPHQEHIIVHELGHMICGHRGNGELDDDTARLFFPDLDPDLVRSYLKRTSYANDQELEAELMASAILEKIDRESRRRETPALEPGSVIARLASSLAEPPETGSRYRPPPAE
ncbi:ImmA/IrrE family metallo-endopeptidase [Amycolatopsis suaedae]|uniref:ImmA/IrrE family metallo-endopeptidase n=1 Tax=Amycolatopsis suaedae TaxID=2510978 RepID=A0A4Q7IYR2_9PSEU|nr:ImmA/IrrE family metallo-endopeptidase [Amycolatopsis suaedae]